MQILIILYTILQKEYWIGVMEMLQLIFIIATKYVIHTFYYYYFFSKSLFIIKKKINNISELQEDILNVKKMGFKAFRMSISWSRVIPSK